MKAQQFKTDWKFVQSFGDKANIDKTQDEDIISALQFDATGQYLGLADRAGRLILFEQTAGKGKIPEFQYLTELQSHVKEFDYLKSADVEEKINQVQWLRPQGKNLYIVTTNDKTIKIWRASEKPIKRAVKQSTLKDLKLPKMEIVDQPTFVPSLIRCYPNLHSYLINNISASGNEEFLLSSDDLRVYLWSLQKPGNTFSVVDLKPENLEDVSEVITCSKYHPTLDNQFLYSTSKGTTKICDLRRSGICDTGGITLIETQDAGSKNFFTDIVSSISDACFSKNGKYVFTRDFLTTKVWDLKMTNKPLVSTNIFEPLKSKLCELYENECIFDKFDISSSQDSNMMITGNFNSTFHLIDRTGETNLQFELNFKKKTIVRPIPKKFFENLGSNYDFNMKVVRTAFHPNLNFIAVACLNALFFYGIS